MPYLIIAVIGAVAGFLAGKYVKGSDDGVGIDIAAGAIGAVVVVLLARLVGPAVVSGLVVSGVIAVIAGVGSLYAMRRFMKTRMVPAPRARRRP